MLVQLGFIIDGSGSIDPKDWTLMVKGLADIVRSSFPKDGSVELTIVQTGIPTDGLPSEARIEVAPFVITECNADEIANQIERIPQGGGLTPLACGFILVADTMFRSLNFDPDRRQFINMITDGKPSLCCDYPGIYLSNPCASSGYPPCNPIVDPSASTIKARDYMIAKLQMFKEDDRICCELVSNDISYKKWLLENIVWPQPGKIAPPYPKDSGWIRIVSSFKELKEAIHQKIKALIPVLNPTAKVNFHAIMTGDQKALAFDAPALRQKAAVATNQFNVVMDQDLPCKAPFMIYNHKSIKGGEQKSIALGSSLATNAVNILTKQR